MNFEKNKVLVIDDQEEIRDLVDITLRDTEFEVIKASSGKEGIQIAKEFYPDTILLDIMMPEFDGFMTCNALNNTAHTGHIFNSETNNEGSKYSY